MRRVINKLKLICKRLEWIIDSYKERQKMHPRKLNNLRGNGLILIPHADDEWIGCSQIISNHEFQVVLCNMDMQGGDDEGLHNIRRKELSEIASMFGREIIRLSENKEEHLRKIIQDTKPDVIYVPYFIDWHEEHIRTMRILSDALACLPNELLNNMFISMYQVSVPIIEQYINAAVPMDKNAHKNKWILFQSIYKTQKFIPYTRFALNEYINGKTVSSYASESFCVISVKNWLNIIEQISLNDNDRKLIKEHLSDISEVRRLEYDLISERIRG